MAKTWPFGGDVPGVQLRFGTQMSLKYHCVHLFSSMSNAYLLLLDLTGCGFPPKGLVASFTRLDGEEGVW